MMCSPWSDLFRNVGRAFSERDPMATTSSSSVVALFSTEGQAAEAISALKAAGFSASQIGAAANSNTSSSTGALSADTTGSYADDTTQSAAGTSLGAKSEGVWDKVKNFFEGNEGGGVEQYANERAHDNASHEVTSGGYHLGSDGYDHYEPADISHSLGGMSIPDEHSRYFEHRMTTGNSSVLVTVTASGREAEAAGILEANGGDLGSGANDYDYSAPAAAGAASGAAVAGEQQRIQLLGEVLRVHKERISRGEVRIRKEIITENQTVQVPVTREELVIERIPTSGTTAVQGSIGENSDIRIPLTEERASLDKQTVVREEVAIGKRAVESVQDVAGSVRHEELNVEEGTETVADPTLRRN